MERTKRIETDFDSPSARPYPPQAEKIRFNPFSPFHPFSIMSLWQNSDEVNRMYRTNSYRSTPKA